MRSFKNNVYFIFFIVVSVLLQSCAITDKKQRDQLLESGRALLKGNSKKSLSEQDIAQGLKEALKVG